MDIRELRIKNFAIMYYEDGQQIVPHTVQISLKDMLLIETEEIICEPIPLTEEWFLKFGLEKTWFGYEDSNIEIDEDEYDKGFTLSINCNEYTEGSHFKYVHQLQNLYFAFMEWINVKDQLPDETIHRDLNNYFSEDVLCYGDGYYFVAYTWNKDWYSKHGTIYTNVEFWQPLPIEPKLK
jgi:hypothetical protein